MTTGVIARSYSGNVGALEDVQKIIDANIRFTLHRERDGRFTAKLRAYRHFAAAQATCATFNDAVAWLKTQVKIRHPQFS